ncbi:hypothetical protein [Riemerella anatipestifer]|uniref:hypothetical protein n=1 Tax=Riemerella anatipestifer TaxID=34085 RepID=UPI000B24E862|nr:hypothetical protein [Riemerella anatipestifer]
MNYIVLINKFWQCNLERCISPNDTRLYFYLLHTCNSLGWKQPFGHSDRHLSIALGMSVNTVRDARNRLMQLGLIDFKTPQKRSKGIDGQTKYVFPTVSTADTVLDTVSDTDIDTVSDTVLDTVSDTNNKLNKTKLNNSSPEDEPQKQKLKSFKKFSENDFSNSLKPFVETYGREMIRDFFDYWTEPSPSGKMKFQLNSTWDTEKRLRTWKKNEDKFGTKQTTQIKIKRNEL